MDINHTISDSSEFYVDVKKLAKERVVHFFADKRDRNGEKISNKNLLSDENVSLVLSTPFDDLTFEFLHSNCLHLIPKPHGYKDSTIPWSVHCLLKLLEEMRDFKVPKQIQPGLVLLYFKLCLGIEPPLANIL